MSVHQKITVGGVVGAIIGVLTLCKAFFGGQTPDPTQVAEVVSGSLTALGSVGATIYGWVKHHESELRYTGSVASDVINTVPAAQVAPAAPTPELVTVKVPADQVPPNAVAV